MFQINHLSVTHTRDLRSMVSDFSLVLQPGDKAAVIGEEGDGKSTLLKLLYDESLVSGYAEWSGEILRGRTRMGYLPQELPSQALGEAVRTFWSEGPSLTPPEEAALLKSLGLPEDLLEDIRYKTLDWLGCVTGALDKKSSRAVLEMARESGGNPQCSAFGLPEKTSMFTAAFSNGVLGHTLEYDDVNKIAITHPGAIAVPAALAAAM